jgi:Na+-driven multidrug efflux pump
MGFPALIRSVLMTSSFVVINNIAGNFSDAALAASAIARKTIGFVTAAIMGFGQSYQPIAGYCWGAGKYKRVQDSFRSFIIIGFSAAVLLGFTMGIFASKLVAIFASSNEPEIIRIGTLMLQSQCIMLIPLTSGVVVNGLSLALGRPVYSTLVGLARNFICLIPSILIMSAVFGVNGLAVSQATADILSLSIVIPIAVSLLREVKRNESLQSEPVRVIS